MHPVKKKHAYKLPLKVEKQLIQGQMQFPLRLIKIAALNIFKCNKITFI